MKIVINKTYGAFYLSEAALCRLAYLKGINLYPQDHDGFTLYYTTPEFADESNWSPYTWDRTDPHLVQVVEEMGGDAGNGSSKLVICNLHSGQQYRICEYDGMEWLEFPSDIVWLTAT